MQEYDAKTDNFKIYELNAEQIAAWKKAMESVYPKFYDSIGQELIQKAIDAQK